MPTYEYSSSSTKHIMCCLVIAFIAFESTTSFGTRKTECPDFTPDGVCFVSKFIPMNKQSPIGSTDRRKGLDAARL